MRTIGLPRRIIALMLGAIGLVSSVTTADSSRYRVDSVRLLAHLKYFSSDDLAGRANGTPALDRAADYIAGQFRQARLEPGGEPGSYFQSFPVTLPPGPGDGNAMVISGPDGDTGFRLGLDFHALSVRDADAGRDGRNERLPLAFAGYGISAPGIGYDDYQGLDVDGKAVVVFTHEPRELDSDSAFGGGALTPHADVAMKAAVAAERGARLLLLVEDYTHPIDRAQAPDWTSDPQIDVLAVPVVRVGRARLATAIPRLDLRAIAQRIDATLVPQSSALDDMTLMFDRTTAVTRSRVRNVVGILRGADPVRAREAIVVGAHYDHLGLGGPLSMTATTAGRIHNGADDNASGTAGMLELARVAASGGRRFRRTLVFVAFAAEEIGLIGSKHYLRQPAVPLERTTLMINLDMIGRAHGRVMIGGRSALEPRARLAPFSRLRLDGFTEGYGDDSSDDAPFARAGIPTVCFFTGFHSDYHRPSDDWDAVDVEGAADIAALALRLAADLANAPAR